MTAEQAVNRALGAAHAMLRFDQSGSMTAQREAEKSAKVVLRQYVEHRTLVEKQSKHEALVELAKAATTLEEGDDCKGVLRLITELEKETDHA